MIAAGAVMLATVALATPDDINANVVVPAPVSDVWQRWTTADGLTRFLARAVNIEARVGGAFEVYFFPANPPGQRGAEGTVLLALEPERRLAFTWDAPPKWPDQRGQRTLVEVRLRAHDEGTEVTLRQTGWGDGEDWQAVRDYFAAAWPKILGRLAYSFETGPVDWDDPPAALMHRGG